MGRSQGGFGVDDVADFGFVEVAGVGVEGQPVPIDYLVLATRSAHHLHE